MKPSPSKTTKAAGRKKRAREEAAGSAAGMAPVSPSRPDPNREWKKSKAKTEDLLALLNSGFLREKEVDMWRAAAGDPYPMEKNPDEIPMFAWFAEHGLSLPTSDFFKRLLGVSSTPPSSYIFAKPFWGSSPIGSCSGSSSG
jgi:hypothetical protein